MKNAVACILIALMMVACSKGDPSEPEAKVMPTTMLERLSFEHYSTVETRTGYGYHVFYEQDADGSHFDIWASGNAGAALVSSKRQPEKFPTYWSADGYEGGCVCLNTQSAGTLGGLVGKPIAAGSLFIGSFNVDKALSDALKTTEFGVPVDRQPLRVTGWYKYTPGEKFTDKNKNVIADRIDEAYIQSVFWRNTNDNGQPVTLYGDNLAKSPYIVSRAETSDLPPAEEWTRFELTFEGDEADAELLAQFGYSFTIVFSSSKDGDLFEGAIGSTLYIDEVEIEFK